MLQMFLGAKKSLFSYKKQPASHILGYKITNYTTVLWN